MATLLLRFAAPMQSWGADSRFDIRRTNREPTKSAAIGLVAAAMGRRRDESVADLAGMKFGVRIDREGTLLRDFHIARKMKKNKPEEVEASYVTHRYYLCDSVFLVGFESNDTSFLEQIEDAVKCPTFPLFLGRRSCPPEGRVCLGIREQPLENALREEPPLVPNSGEMRILMDVDGTVPGGAVANDLPISFDPNKREHTSRHVQQIITYTDTTVETEHDPMAEWE